MTQTEIREFIRPKSEADKLRDVLSEILDGTYVVKSTAYCKVLVESRVINRAKELVHGES